jgi:UDP-N-acetylmuramoyl-tripeptide--D-alanyl-D-alanine ligase
VIAGVVGGAHEGPDVEVSGVAIDSRRVRGGELFVPLRGRVDGHEFVADALAAGAAAYLTAIRSPGGVSADQAAAIVVDDTAAALSRLGRDARRRLPDRVIGITGSTGKTSTKDLAGTVLARLGPCAVSERSHNNELGVPLTLANAPDDAEAAVLELGARGAGHIAWLCEMARPTVGVVVNVTLAHTEMLGSLDGVAAAKAELVADLPASGTAVLNADDERVVAMRGATRANVLTFGVAGGEVRATGMTLDRELRPAFRLETPWGEAAVKLEVRGAHQAQNAAAAAAAVLALGGVDLEQVADGLEHARLSPWRMELRRSAGGGVVLNDAYNANPASTEAALRALASLPAERRVAVLGPMLELGVHAAAEHRRIAALASALGIGRVIAIGAPEYGVEGVAGVEAAAALIGTVGPDDAVLVKGSRAAGLEHLVAMLAEPEPEPEPEEAVW